MEKKIRTDDILDSAKNALKILLDAAFAAESVHPVPCEAVAELEFVIHELEYRDT